MRLLPALLAASLALNVAVLAGYLTTRRNTTEPPAPPSVEEVLRELAFTEAQQVLLRDTRRALRSDLRPIRAELQPKFEAALKALLQSQPGEPSFDAAMRATIDGRTEQLLVIAKHLLAFRAQLTPEQRAVFDRHVGEWSFVQTWAGLRPPFVSGGPIGPFQQTDPQRNAGANGATAAPAPTTPAPAK